MLRTLAHYWRVNLAVSLGAAVAAAVLAGALTVGDSVRGSLRGLTLDRLGAIDHALIGSGFFRDDLAADLAQKRGGAAAVPAIVLGGSARHADTGARASKISIHGVDDSFAGLFGSTLDLERKQGQLFPSVVLNESLGRELGARPGDAVLLSFGRWSEVPRETLMGETDPDHVLGSLRATVTAVIPDRGMGRFGLTPRQQSPLNAFLPVRQLQRTLRLQGRVNTILVSNGDSGTAEPDAALREVVKLEDLGLRLRPGEGHFTVESREFVLRPVVEEAIDTVAQDLGLPVLPTQSYLANEMRVGERATPYSMMTALDPRNGLAWATLPQTDGTRAPKPGADGILLNAWTADDLAAEVGDVVEVTYYGVGLDEELTEERASLRVEGIVAMRDLGADATLTPDYPGIQEAEDISAWEPPFPVDLDRIRTKDELYWDLYGAAPKAFVARETGRRLWSSRFGSTTSIRVGASPGGDLDETRESFGSRLLERLPPKEFGLSFRPVKEEGLRAARGATDFASLFLSFSFFLIFSAALLVGLLFRLGVEQRAGEIGLLVAVGHAVSKVRRRLLVEGLLLAAVGGALGLAAGVGFAGLMMVGLRTIWRPAVGSSELYLHVSPTSLAIGWGGTLFVVLLSVYFAVRRLVRIPSPQLLRGSVTPIAKRVAGRVSGAIAWGCLAGSVGLAATGVATGTMESPGLAFGTGSLLLTSGLVFFSRWCRASRRGRMAGALLGMAARNSAWNPGRSVLSVALVGAACFMIVVVEVFRIEPGLELEAKDSGSGGFALVAESDVPLHQDLNDRDGRLELGFDAEGSALLDNATVYGARVVPGDDASCLNLYQPEKPTLLGLDRDFVRRGGFAFQQLLDLVEGSDPWSLLEGTLEDGVVPAMTDVASAMWILHLGLGDELTMQDELGRPLRLRLVGLLSHSIFRSEVLISEKNLLEHFPGRSGASYFLIETEAARTAEISQALEGALDPFGFDVTTVRDKIAGYEAVQNTYLSTFQVLGGLGLLLGTVGLGVVLVRNVIERRGELATLRAFGFRRSRLAWIVLAENAFLLCVGVLIGTVAAAAAVAPSLADRALPWPSLAGTLVLVFAVGMLSSLAAVAGTLRIQLLPALKAEH